MRILVTGVTGQVGKALVAPLARLGTVVPSDRSTLNLAEPATLAGALDRLAPDLIINPAVHVREAGNPLLQGACHGSLARRRELQIHVPLGLDSFDKS